MDFFNKPILSTKRLVTLAVVVAVVLLLTAILGSLAYGLAYLTRLDSYNDATKF